VPPLAEAIKTAFVPVDAQVECDREVEFSRTSQTGRNVSDTSDGRPLFHTSAPESGCSLAALNRGKQTRNDTHPALKRYCYAYGRGRITAYSAG